MPSGSGPISDIETPKGTTPNRSRADRFMRRLLRIQGDPVPGAVFDAQNKLRSSIIISGIRCVITYLLIPILTPVISLSGRVTAPVGILLSVVAIGFGINSLRRFWLADHRLRWRYTTFITVVFVLLLVGIGFDLATLIS